MEKRSIYSFYQLLFALIIISTSFSICYSQQMINTPVKTFPYAQLITDFCVSPDGNCYTSWAVNNLMEANTPRL